jgi:hypothetical protein
MEDAGVFYAHLVHFMVCFIFYGIACGNLKYFSRFGILYQEKIWQSW